MTRELDLELLLDSSDTSDYTFDTLETPAHPSTIRDSQASPLDDSSMQCEVSPLLDASPSFQSTQGNGMRMALESRYYQAKSTGNVEDFVKIVSLIEGDRDTWMEIIRCKCLKFILESYVTSKRYQEAILCIKAIIMANIPRVQMQRIIKAVLEAVEREGDSSMNWCVFVEAFTECLLSSLDKTRDSVRLISLTLLGSMDHDWIDTTQSVSGAQETICLEIWSHFGRCLDEIGGRLYFGKKYKTAQSASLDGTSLQECL